jgi:hypothetical protein
MTSETTAQKSNLTPKSRDLQNNDSKNTRCCVSDCDSVLPGKVTGHVMDIATMPVDIEMLEARHTVHTAPH